MPFASLQLHCRWVLIRRRLWREKRSHALLALDLLERPPLGARSSRLLARGRGAAARPWFGLGGLGLGVGVANLRGSRANPSPSPRPNPNQAPAALVTGL
jgi:hypothetical protein